MTDTTASYSALKETTLTVSGVFDPEVCEHLYGASSPGLRAFEWAPKGYRRPWYPIHATKIKVADWSFGDGEYSCEFNAVAPITVSRVGVRRWWRERKRRDTSKDFAG